MVFVHGWVTAKLSLLFGYIAAALALVQVLAKSFRTPVTLIVD